MNDFPKVIAIDFDGTLCEDKYPKIGNPKLDVIHRILDEQNRGAKVILWTCRCGDELQEAVVACKRWGIRLDAVNENLSERIERFHSDPRKVGADEYWDDKAIWIT